MKKKYETQIYNTVKTFIYAILFFLIAMSLLFLLGFVLNSPLIPAIGFCFVLIVPFMFEKKIKNKFTKQAILEFDQLSFTVSEYNQKNILSNKSIFRWSDVKSYYVNFTSSKITYLTIYLSKGSSKTFGFKDNKTFEEAIKQESVFGIFHSFLNQFNKTNEQNNKIILAKSFFTTRFGTRVLISLICLFVFAIGIHVYKSSQTSFASLLMGFFIIMQLVIKRKKDKEFYCKINNLPC